MPRFSPGCFAGILAATLLPGCRLPGLGGATADSLVASRRLSRDGVAYIEQAQWQKAEPLLADAVKTCPADAEARRHYAETLLHRGAYPDAIKHLEEVCRQCPEDAATRVRLAEVCLDLGQIEPARTHIEQAIALDPRLAHGWAVRGRLMQVTGQLQQALADYHRAQAYAPDDRKVMLDVAELYRQLNQPQRAMETLQTLADSYSPGQEPQQVLYLLGLSYVALHRYDEGAESLAAAVTQRVPGEQPVPEIWFRLGEAQLLAGHQPEAEAALQQALNLEPRHQASRELLGRIELARAPVATVRR